MLICFSPDRPGMQVVDISTLRTLVFPLPDFAWRQMAGMCGRTITPMYKTIHTMLSEDMEHVVQVLSELEPPSGNNFDDNKVSCCILVTPAGDLFTCFRIATGLWPYSNYHLLQMQYPDTLMPTHVLVIYHLKSAHIVNGGDLLT
jgi:hypothetical protein